MAVVFDGDQECPRISLSIKPLSLADKLPSLKGPILLAFSSYEHGCRIFIIKNSHDFLIWAFRTEEIKVVGVG